MSIEWPWSLPILPNAEDDSFLGKTSTKITVQPVDCHRERWDWRVEVLFDGRQSLMGWALGGSRRHPEPMAVGGRTRDEGKAWERARSVVADWNARKAAEELRRTMVRTQVVPQ